MIIADMTLAKLFQFLKICRILKVIRDPTSGFSDLNYLKIIIFTQESIGYSHPSTLLMRTRSHLSFALHNIDLRMSDHGNIFDGQFSGQFPVKYPIGNQVKFLKLTNKRLNSNC